MCAKVFKTPRNRATKKGYWVCYRCHERINANERKKRRPQSLNGKSETVFNVVYHTKCFKIVSQNAKRTKPTEVSS